MMMFVGGLCAAPEWGRAGRRPRDITGTELLFGANILSLMDFYLVRVTPRNVRLWIFIFHNAVILIRIILPELRDEFVIRWPNRIAPKAYNFNSHCHFCK